MDQKKMERVQQEWFKACLDINTHMEAENSNENSIA
jgi:hypothetical protein